MDNKIIDLLRVINYWDSGPPARGIERRGYLEVLKGYFDNNLVKVLVGQRRAGKSYILMQLMAYLVREKQVGARQLLYLNFELHQLGFVRTDQDLTQIIDVYLETVDATQTVYLFLDEIQEVMQWERAVTSYMASPKFQIEIVITGSNSNLLSSELATYLTGRYVTKEIRPFSYDEFLQYYVLARGKESLLTYLHTTGIPEAYNLVGDELKISFFSALKESILMKDIVRRYQIRNPQLLNHLFLFLVDNIGNLFSANKIVKTLASLHIDTNVNTLMMYLNYLESAFLILGVDRYDTKGKRILEGEKKYYLNDLAFKNYLTSSFDPRPTKLLENFVLNQLKISGYSVFVGRINGLEIDFIAQKGARKYYFQVAYSLQDEAVLEREYASLEALDDHWPKIVVSLDDFLLNPKNGIVHLRAWELDLYVNAT